MGSQKPVSGWGFKNLLVGGSSINTSSAAPAHWPPCKARSNAASSMMPPRATLTTRTLDLHLAKTASFIRPAEWDYESRAEWDYESTAEWDYESRAEWDYESTAEWDYESMAV